MMRLALSKLARRTNAGTSGTLCCARNRPLSTTSEHWRSWHSNQYYGLSPPPPQPQFTARAFHSTVGVLDYERNTESRQGGYPPRRDQKSNNDFSNNRNRNNGHHANKAQRGGGNGSGNNNNNNNFFNGNKGGSELSPTYITHLQQRARDHIRNFPADSSSSNNQELLSPWHRTTVELVMLLSKIWGKQHRSDQRDICNFVSLANDMVIKTLDIKKRELDELMEESKSEATFSDDGIDGTNTKQRQQVMPRGEHMNTEVLCQTVALGWSRCDPKIAVDAAQNAQEVLDRLEHICSTREKIHGTFSTEVHDVTPSMRIYNHVLNCWSRSSDRNAERRAKELFDRMAESRGTFCRPDTISHNNILHLYANKGKGDAAEALLKKMEDPNSGVSTDVYSYSIVMNAFQKRFVSSGRDSRNMKELERAEELLSRLVTKFEQSGFRDGKLRPTSVTFGTVIAMYAQADRILKEDDRLSNKTRSWKAGEVARKLKNNKTDVGWGASNAERVLDWIIGLSERERRSKSMNSDFKEDNAEANRGGGYNPDDEVIRPNTHHFVSVMDAWAKAGKGVEGAQHCERLLDRLVSMYNKLGYAELRPNPMCYGTVINAWSKADDRHETAEHAEKLLYRMEEMFLNKKSSNPREMLSNIAYNLVIDAWSRRTGNDKAERADNILRRLINNYQQTNNRFLRPDVISYTGAMKAHVNHPEGGERALKILEEMKNESRDGNARARPDAQSLAVAMDACAKSGLTSEAERILKDADDSLKTRVMFNTVMSGYKKEGRGHKAEAVLRRMIDLSDNAGLQRCSPDVISYTLCIEAWGNSTGQDRVSRARMLLDESMERYRGGDSTCKPSNSTFNVTALCIADSDVPDKENHVLSLFEKMEDSGCKPCLVSFNIVIKTCASATGSEERKKSALQVAFSAYNSLPSAGLRAESITYISMFHAMINLMEDSPEKVTAIANIFQQCCDDGCLNQHMINILAGAMSAGDFLSITGVSSNKNTAQMKNLPAKWSQRSSDDNGANTELFF